MFLEALFLITIGTKKLCLGKNVTFKNRIFSTKWGNPEIKNSSHLEGWVKMELWKMSQKVSELSDVIPYYFFSLVSSCLSLSTVMVMFSEGSWGCLALSCFLFILLSLIYYLLFRYRSFSINILKNSVHFIFPFYFSLCWLYSFIVRCLILTSVWKF